MVIKKKKSKNLKDEVRARINEEIKVPQIRLIEEDGTQLGILSVSDAIMKAHEAGLDLVEVAPEADPPVCRIMDFGKFKYKQKKKVRDSRKKVHTNEVKELRLKPRIEEHDLSVKMKKARDLLEGGYKVMFNVMFRGRELAHKEFGLTLLQKVTEELSDIATPEMAPKEEGRKISVTFSKSK